MNILTVMITSTYIDRLPPDMMRHIVSLGGINRLAGEALVMIQRKWRVLRKRARRHAAHVLQDMFRITYRNANPDEFPDATFYLTGIRRYTRRRLALRTM